MKRNKSLARIKGGKFVAGYLRVVMMLGNFMIIRVVCIAMVKFFVFDHLKDVFLSSFQVSL